ncbi:hypothetical protein [Microcoleus sp.]
MRYSWALGIGHWALGIGHWALARAGRVPYFPENRYIAERRNKKKGIKP